MKLLAVVLLMSGVALGQEPRIGDALRCENGKCSSKPNDGPVIVQLLKTIREQEERIQALEKRTCRTTKKEKMRDLQ